MIPGDVSTYCIAIITHISLKFINIIIRYTTCYEFLMIEIFVIEFIIEKLAMNAIAFLFEL